MQCPVTPELFSRRAVRLHLGLAKLAALNLNFPAQALVAPQLSDVVAIGIICPGTHALSYSGLDNGFERARVKAAKKAEDAGHPDLAARIHGFQFRDLRAKAGTEKADAEGILEAKRQLGHASVTMTEQYVRLGQIVTPTR